VPTKRALAKADAAELIDIESRLAPYFPRHASTLPARAEHRPELEDDL
jgi:hypothetical protein